MALEPSPPLSRRLELHALLLTLADDNAYFQPPSDFRMQYPCIRYEQADADIKHADNIPYLLTKRWKLTVIDPDPDSIIRDRVESLPMCGFERFYPADNLNHFVFNLFF